MRSALQRHRAKPVLFYDDFDGTNLNTAQWVAKTFTAGSGVVWDPSAVTLDGNSNLVITANLVSGVWHSGFISGTVSYQGPHHIEARASLPNLQGTWPAPIWAWQSPNGTSGVEVDVCEQLGNAQATQYHTTVHASGTVQATFNNTVASNLLTTGYHTYSADVHSDHADFFLDGVLVRTITPSSGGLAGAWPFTTTAMVVNVDLNMGGWAGTIGSETTAQMIVDYVRVTGL